MGEQAPSIAEKVDTCKHCHKQIWYSTYTAQHDIKWYHTHNNNAFCIRYHIDGTHAEPDESEDLPLSMVNDEM